MFSPRITSNGIYNSPWWYSSGNIYYSAYQLPNCTCYCYGRYAEILGEFKPLPNANGGDWYRLATAFNRGQTPALGAIACWYSPNAAYYGHVAVVEQILDSGDIVTSNSGYYRPINAYPPSTPSYFWTETCYKSNGYRSSWEASRGYRLAGFIYLDAEPIPAPDLEWIKGNRFLTQEEMANNAYIIYSLLYAEGWTLNAVAGLMGNLERESTINPGIWENLTVNPSNGFGLVGWTPSTVYTDWAAQNGYEIDDGNGQVYWIEHETVPRGQWIPTTKYPLSFDEFKESTDTPENLASAFMYNFERPGVPAESDRRKFAREWYDYLYYMNPANPEPDIDDKKKHMKPWQMIRRW